MRLAALRWWDVETLLPLERHLFGATAWTAEMFWAELAHPGTRWYVRASDDDGEVIGYAGLLVPGPEADVQTIAVAPAAQGRGVGGTLLDALITRARERGATSLMLEVRADNPPAIRLYEKRGFERIAIRRRYYQPGDVDAWVMRLRPLPAGDGDFRRP
jgi:ribosomal-protein-alanine N-acetyltransferase